LLYKFSDVLRYAFYVHSFSYSRRSFLWHEWPPLDLAENSTTKVNQWQGAMFRM
jgi:hypothetical protein